jgi:hypothetical protein
MAKKLAEAAQEWSRRAATEMPCASGDIREIVDQPVFVPLYSLFRVYGPIFKLSFGPQSFVVVSDPDAAKQVRTSATLCTMRAAPFFHDCIKCVDFSYSSGMDRAVVKRMKRSAAGGTLIAHVRRNFRGSPRSAAVPGCDESSLPDMTLHLREHAASTLRGPCF